MDAEPSESSLNVRVSPVFQRHQHECQARERGCTGHRARGLKRGPSPPTAHPSSSPSGPGGLRGPILVAPCQAPPRRPPSRDTRAGLTGPQLGTPELGLRATVWLRLTFVSKGSGFEPPPVPEAPSQACDRPAAGFLARFLVLWVTCGGAAACRGSLHARLTQALSWGRGTRLGIRAFYASVSPSAKWWCERD